MDLCIIFIIGAKEGSGGYNLGILFGLIAMFFGMLTLFAWSDLE